MVLDHPAQTSLWMFWWLPRCTLPTYDECNPRRKRTSFKGGGGKETPPARLTFTASTCAFLLPPPQFTIEQHINNALDVQSNQCANQMMRNPGLGFL